MCASAGAGAGAAAVLTIFHFFIPHEFFLLVSLMVCTIF